MQGDHTKLILTGVLVVLIVLVTALPSAQTSSSGHRRADDVTWVSEARQAHQPTRSLAEQVRLRVLALVAALVLLVAPAHWLALRDRQDRERSDRHLRWSARSRRGPPAFV